MIYMNISNTLAVSSINCEVYIIIYFLHVAKI